MNVYINYDLSDGKIQSCAKCEKQISDRYFLKALNLFWHEDCLKCDSCNCRLCDLATTFYIRENFLLCRSDYMRFYGNTGLCSACNKLIPAFEMVMRAKRNIYHLECFACQQCSHRFCVGDRFYLCENKILCENDFDIRQHILKDNINQNQRYNNHNNNNSKLNNVNQNINNNNNDNDNDYINNNNNNNTINNNNNSLNFCEIKKTPNKNSSIDKKRSTTSNVDVFIGAK